MQDTALFDDNLNIFMRQSLRHYRIPGASIAWIHGGQIRCVKGFGLMDKRSGKPAHADTVYQVASISKVVTAWGVMRLVERGKIDLDAPIGAYLTAWQFPGSAYEHVEVTVRRLLNHSAGVSIPSYPGHRTLNNRPSLLKSLSRAVLGEKLRVVCEPGITYQYSGGGYALLQVIIEEVAGVPFHEYMQNEILIPLGMKNSSFRYESNKMNELSKPYGIFGHRLPNYLFVEEAAAGLYSTAGDLAQFMLASIAGANNEPPGRGVIKPETLLSMYRRDIRTSNAGLGYMVTVVGGNKIIYYKASNRGWYALYRLNATTSNGVILLTNSDNGRFLVEDMMYLCKEWEADSKISTDFSLLHREALHSSRWLYYRKVFALYMKKRLTLLVAGPIKYVRGRSR